MWKKISESVDRSGDIRHANNRRITSSHLLFACLISPLLLTLSSLFFDTRWISHRWIIQPSLKTNKGLVYEYWAKRFSCVTELRRKIWTLNKILISTDTLNQTSYSWSALRDLSNDTNFVKNKYVLKNLEKCRVSSFCTKTSFSTVRLLCFITQQLKKIFQFCFLHKLHMKVLYTWTCDLDSEGPV